MNVKIIQAIAFSLLPLLGVLFFSWDWREIIVLYWFENITVGIVTLLSILRSKDTISASPTGAIEVGKTGATDNPAGRGFLAVFFCIHYGMFTVIHGIFVFFVILGFFGSTESGHGAEGLQWLQIIGLWALMTAIRVVMTLLGPTPSLDGGKSLFAPYKRIFALHLTIILGIFLIIGLHLPAIAAVLLIVLHAVIDVLSLKPFAKK